MSFSEIKRKKSFYTTRHVEFVTKLFLQHRQPITVWVEVRVINDDP